MSGPNTKIQRLPRATVFYDGGCALRSREIAHYRRLDRDGELRWLDVQTDADALARHGLDRETAMRRFHVLDARGEWQTGAWGFAEIWSHLPRYRWLSRVLRHVGVLPLLDRVYSRFARWRLRRRCSDGCAIPREMEP